MLSLQPATCRTRGCFLYYGDIVLDDVMTARWQHGDNPEAVVLVPLPWLIDGRPGGADEVVPFAEAFVERCHRYEDSGVPM